MSDISQICDTCESKLMLIVRFDGKEILTCTTCGAYASNNQSSTLFDDIAGPNEDEIGRIFAHSINNPTSRGHHHGLYTGGPTRNRKEAVGLISRMCDRFSLSFLKKEMEALFSNLNKFRPMRVGACGVFMVKSRQSFQRQEISQQVTLQQVSDFSGIKISKISKAITFIERNILSPEELESSRKGSVGGDDTKFPFPVFEVRNPITHEDATEKVRELANKIILVVKKLSSHRLDFISIPIAACSLAYQSCFFWQRAKEMPSLEDFVKIVGMDCSTSIRNSETLIRNEMIRLTQDMKFLGRRPKKKVKYVREFLARNLEIILKNEDFFCRHVLLKADAARQKEPVVNRVAPRELTKEEVEILEAPELTDKDLPEQELGKYLLDDAIRLLKEDKLGERMIQDEQDQALRKEKRLKQNAKKGQKRKIEPVQQSAEIAKIMHWDDIVPNACSDICIPGDEQIEEEQEEQENSDSQIEEEQFDYY